MTTGRALAVLVVEDDPRLRDILTTHLDRMGYVVRGSGNAEDALQKLAEAPADVLISDVRMPGMDGRALLRVARERHPSVKVVLMTAFGTVDDAVEAMRDGAYTYVCKPFKVDQITAALRNAAREVALLEEVEGLPRVLQNAVRPAAPGDPPAPRVPTLAEVEKAHVERVLALCDWNRTATARVLQIDCRTLLAKIERYGLIGPVRAGARHDEECP